MSEVRNLNEQGSFLKRGSLLKFIIGVIAATTTILTTYHTTIYGLREELNKKADTELVASIDNRLIHIEAILNERMATKSELQQTRDFLYEKLTTIEARLQMLP